MASATLKEAIPPNSDVLAAAGASVTLKGLSKSYGGAVAIDSVDLEIEAGEFISLLGPSGSGKTTTLNSLSGMITPDSGTVAIGGRLLNDVPPHKRGLGVVFQHYALFPNMTVEENVRFPLEEQKFPKRDIPGLVDLALAAVRMDGYRDRYPAQLSGGQQQRVAFARAIVFKPSVLLMDEPLGALDRNLRESMQTEIRRIHRDVGSTFIYVTHDQEEALALSDRIAVFNEGRIEQLGTPEELYLHPQSLFVAQFFGETNRWQGAIKSAADGVAEVDTPDGVLSGRVTTSLSGEQATIIVRPESIRVGACDPQHGRLAKPNHVTGEVNERTFLGSTLRLRIATADATEVVARVSATGAQRGLVPGDSVELSWDASHAYVFTD